MKLSYSFHNSSIGGRDNQHIFRGEWSNSLGTYPHCGNATLNVSPASGSPHHSRLDCLGCGRWIRWLPDAKKVEAWEQLRRRVESIPLNQLRGWDHTFINDRQKQARISRRDKKKFTLSSPQLIQLERIECKLGGGHYG